MAIQNDLNLTATGVITASGAGVYTGSAVTNGAVLLGSTSNAITDTGVLAKGTIIVGDGATAPTLLTVGTDTHVLTADSAAASGVKWAAASGGGSWVWLSTQTPSAVATVNFDNVFISTYARYLVIWDNMIPVTDDVLLYCRVGTGATPTYRTDATYSWGGSSIAAPAASTNSTRFTMSGQNAGTNIGNDALYGSSGFQYFFNPLQNTYTKSVWSAVNINTSPPTLGQIDYGGVFYTQSIVTSFQFFFSSGNISSGTISLFGIKET